MRKFALLFFIVLALISNAQIRFQAAYHTGNDMFSSVQQTTDNGYIMAGWQMDILDFPSTVVKTDTAGIVQWQKKYLNNASGLVKMYMINKLAKTSDGGYILTGNVMADLLFGTDYNDLFLTKTNANGDITWSYRYGSSDEDAGMNVIQTTDGGYLAVGYTYGLSAKDSSNIYIVKTNSTGTLLWDKAVEISTIDDDQGLSVTETSDGYIFAGYTSQVAAPDTTTDIVYFKTNTSGTIQWLHTQGDITEDDQAAALEVINNGDIILSGYTGDVSGLNTSDLFLWKLNNTNGNLIGTYKYNLSIIDAAAKLKKTTDGGFILTGYTGLLSFNPFLVKFNSNLDAINAHQYTSGSLSIYNDADATTDGGYVVGTMGMDGSLGYAYRITKADQNGYSGCMQDSLTVERNEFIVSLENPTYNVYNGGSRNNFTPQIETDWTVDHVTYCSYVPCDTPIVLISPTNPSICSGQSQTLTASGATTYVWNTSATTSSITVSPTSQTTYTVTGYVGVCPSNPTSVTVNVNPVPTALINGVDGGSTTICEGNSTSLTASGGTTYTWSSGSGNPQTVSPTTGTTYTVTVSNSYNCTDVTTHTVNVNTMPTATISGGGTICDDGSSANISINFTGSANWNFVWALNGTTQPAVSGVSSNPYTIPVTTAGTYTLVSIEDNSGCSGTVSGSASVIVNPLPNIVITGNTSICDGASTTLTASGGNSYHWSTGDNVESTTVTPISTTDYYVTVTNTSTTCQNTETVSVIVNSLPIISIFGNTTICSGDTAFITASGGTTYEWSNGDLTATTDLIPTTNTTYFVTVSNGNCSNTASQLITVNELPNITISGNTSICAGDSTLLTAFGGDTYLWNTTSDSASTLVNPLTDTYYTVTATNTSTNCSNTLSQQVLVNPLPNITITGNTSVCIGNSTSLTANGSDNYIWSNSETTSTINITPTNDSTFYVIGTSSFGCKDTNYINIQVHNLPIANAGSNDSICIGSSTILHGNGGTSYNWSPSSSLNDATNQNPLASPTSTTNYILTVTDANSCTNTDTVTITILPQINYVISHQNLRCNGDSSGSAWVSFVDGEAPFSYNWSNLSNDSVINNLGEGTYFITITDAFGCTIQSNIFIDQPDSLTSTLVKNNVLCYGEHSGNIVIDVDGGTPNYTYNWSNGSVDTALYNITAGQYSVTIIDDNNCFITINSIIITEPENALNYSITSQNNVTCFGYTNGSIFVEANGGTPNYTYNWSNYSPTNSITNVAASNYYLTITDENNCAIVDTITITEPYQLILIDTLQMNGSVGNANITALGGTPAYSYIWNTGYTSNQYNSLHAGEYTVTVTDANGCTASTLITIDVPLIIPSVITPNNDGKNDNFQIVGIEAYNTIEIHIFTRWGDEVFDYSGTGIAYADYANQWNGTSKASKELPLGSYVYVIYLNNKSLEFNGTVTIVR